MANGKPLNGKAMQRDKHSHVQGGVPPSISAPADTMQRIIKRSFGQFVQCMARAIAPKDTKPTRKGQVTYITRKDIATDVWGHVSKRDIR